MRVKPAPAQNATPILHLTKEQLEEFKHADPNQAEPDIAFPKDVKALYADKDEPVDDKLAVDLGITAQSVDTESDGSAEEENAAVEEDSQEGENGLAEDDFQAEEEVQEEDSQVEENAQEEDIQTEEDSLEDDQDPVA